MMQIDDLIAQLNRLMHYCTDGETSCLVASKAAASAEARTRLDHHSRQLGRLARELGQWLERFGAASVDLDPMRAQSRDDNGSGSGETGLLTECQRLEWNTREAYAEALRDDLPLNIKMVVQRQYSEIKAMHEALRRLEFASHGH